MKRLGIITALAMLNGCAVIRQEVTITAPQTNGPPVVTRLASRIYTIGSAAATVERAKVAGGRAPAIGLSGVDGQSSGTNVVAVLEQIKGIIAAMPK